MKLRNIFMTVSLVLGLLCSCIKENHEYCHNYYYVDLSYMGDGIKEIFNKKISKVQMYIFDSSLACLSVTELSQDDIDARQVQLPPLHAGDYKIVFLGNPYNTFVGGLTSGALEKMLFAAEDYVDEKTVSTNDSLYFASMTYTIEPYNMRRPVTRDTVSFNAAHYDVSVEITGVPPLESSSDKYAVVKIEGLSPYTDFTQTVCGEPTEYELDMRYDGVNTMTGRCNIMRHLNHEDVWLKVYTPFGEELAAVNFATFITTNNIDCEKQEVLIPFQVEFKSSGVNVTVPDWAIEDIYPDYE